MKVCGDVLMETFPRITTIHGTEHVISLFFQDVFTKIPEYKLLVEIAKVFRNMFGSTRQVTKAMFDGYSKKHNRGIMGGFIKPSECRYVILKYVLELTKIT